MRNRLKLLLALLGLVLVIGAAQYFFADRFEPKALLEWMRQMGSRGWAIPAFVLVYAVATTFLAPALSFHIVAAVLWGFWEGLLISMVTCNAVSNLHFQLGRWIGREKVRAWLEKKGWSRLVKELETSGVGTMIAIRQLPLPFVAVNVACGASPLKAWHFAAGTAIGALPPTLVYTSFASALLEGVAGSKREALVRALGAGAVMITITVGPKLFKWWKARRAARQTAPT